jgi:uncharacterized membrane protein
MSTEHTITTGSGRIELLDDRTAVQPHLGVEVSQIPHDCAPETLLSQDQQSTARLIGIDLARALAIVGMVAVHLLPMVDRDGAMSTAFVLSSGKSSALFAVLAGVGIALSTGRTRRPTGRRWHASLAEVAVRALLIGVLGLGLGYVVPADDAQVILAYYAVLFLLAIPLLRVPARALAVLAVVIAVGVPLLSHWWRQSLPPARELNPTFATLTAQPVGSLELLLLTGAFPALAWMAYVCAGLAIGRAALGERRLMVRLVVLGVGLAVMASAASWFLMEAMGGRVKLAAVASQSMALEEFTDFLVWGGEGVLPTTSPWWLGVLAPHTSTPVDILFTLGIAVATIGVALILGVVAPNILRPIAAIGSMPLTLYAGHLLLLAAPFMPESEWLEFALHLVVLVVFALVWRRFVKRGPLELLLGWASHRVGRLILNRTRSSSETR